MKALSIQQPWAWLIAAGYKTVENRSWRTNFRGRFLVHASKKMALSRNDMAEFRREMREVGIEIPEILPTSGIIGEVEIVDCVTDCADANDAEWHEPGMYAFVLRHARELPFRPMKGKLHWFDIE